jgi:hypothetical protein
MYLLRRSLFLFHVTRLGIICDVVSVQYVAPSCLYAGLFFTSVFSIALTCVKQNVTGEVSILLGYDAVLISNSLPTYGKRQASSKLGDKLSPNTA